MPTNPSLSSFASLLAQTPSSAASDSGYGLGTWLGIAAGVLLLVLLATALRDISQKKHAIIHNFPVVGHSLLYTSDAADE